MMSRSPSVLSLCFCPPQTRTQQHEVASRLAAKYLEATMRDMDFLNQQCRALAALVYTAFLIFMNTRVDGSNVTNHQYIYYVWVEEGKYDGVT